MSQKHAIKVEHISKTYGNKSVLTDISLTVHQGHCVALLGENGAGKSTLLKILATLIKPTQGNAWVNGFSIIEDPINVRKSLGFVFQSTLLDKQLTVCDNLQFAAALFGLSKKNALERIKTVLAIFELSDLLNKRVKSLSGGTQRTIDIARCLLHKPSVIMLDEPTAGLDKAHRTQLFEHLELLKTKEKATILFSTHQLEETKSVDAIFSVKAGHAASCLTQPSH
ncbi:MAG: ABC transporter ATP-binding protein [Proteobacteria bacterium]|nr:ABC transporter ATP-binding protein [Pseudomonadota bacterium]